jgi:tRNA(fMet)-specific endonuclease VapC
MILLDTNICIYILKKKPLSVLKEFKRYDVGQIGVSSITYAELSHGVYKSQSAKKNKEKLNHFIAPIEILQFGEKEADVYGKIKTTLEKKGKIIGNNDILIAAHALSLNATLITNNEAEFQRIEELRVENWI